MSCNMCMHTHMMYGGSKYPDGAEVCCNIEQINGEPALTMTAYFIAHPEYESQTVYRGWVPISNCPWCGAKLVDTWNTRANDDGGGYDPLGDDDYDW